MKNLTKKCFEENKTPLDFVREFIEVGNFQKAIAIVSRFKRLPKTLSIVKDTHEVINNPSWAKLYLKDKAIEQAIEESVQVIKIEYKF